MPSFVRIPPPPASAGTLTVEAEMDANEVSVLTQKLRGVLQLVQASSSNGGGANGDAALGALGARLAALRLRVAGADQRQQQQQQQQHQPALVQQQQQQQQPLAAQPPQVAIPVPAPIATLVQAPPIPVPVPAAPIAAPAAQAPPIPVPTPALPPQQQQPQQQAWAAPAAAPAAPRTAGPPPMQQQQQQQAAPTPAAAAAAPAWRQCFSSDPADHAGGAVAALAYVPRIVGLPAGDGHHGWLISSARGVVNLFECNAGGGSKGIPSLMLMHSQEVDLLCSRLAVETATGLMFAASVATDAAAEECVSVHSLDVERLLAFRYRFAPPRPKGHANARPGGGAGGGNGPRLITQVASVHGVGGVLARGCVASYGSRLVLFQAPTPEPPPNSTLSQTLSAWDAHPGAQVTALHLSPHAPTLWSGANDGGAAAWDLRARPTAPAVALRGHARNVTGLATVNDATLASCGIDGRVLLWDPRRAGEPRAEVAPDGSPCLRLAPSPFGDCLAVSTNRGLHAVDLVDGALGVAPVAPFPLARPFGDVAWNAATGELYAAKHTGAVVVFTREA